MRSGGWHIYCTQLPEHGAEREQYEFAIEFAAAQKVIGGVSLTHVSRLRDATAFWLSA
jgi:hypothetical protein